jgi:hypothetical protein
MGEIIDGAVERFVGQALAGVASAAEHDGRHGALGELIDESLDQI